MNIEKIKIPSTKGNLAIAIHNSEKPTDKLAILCPGYLDSKDYKHLVGLAEVLNGRDYTVIRFDPTGTWESDGDISDYTVTQYLDDIKSVLEYMLAKGDYNDILLGGHSRGGQLSILYSARDPKISTILGIMPSSGPITGKKRDDWDKLGVSISQRDLPDDRNKTKEFCVPFDHVLDRDQYDAVGDIKKIKSPVILIAGELDEVVEPEDVKELFENANEPKKFIIIPNIGHDYRLNDDEVKLVNEEILKQLDSIKI